MTFNQENFTNFSADEAVAFMNLVLRKESNVLGLPVISAMMSMVTPNKKYPDCMLKNGKS